MIPKPVDPRKLKPGPIRHEELPLSLVARINHLRLTLDEAYPQSMEKWLDGFRQDAHPEDEVRWWERLARCYVAYSDTKDLNVGQKQAVFSVLFKLGMGFQTEKLEADLATLPDGALEEMVATLGERTQ
jgi:hypothetical protein